MYLIELDKKIFLYFYHISEKYQHLRISANYFSKFAKIYFYVVYLIGLFYLYSKNNLNLKFVYIPLSVYTLLKVFRIIVKRKRPFLCFPNLDLPKTKKYSFPSNHTGASFILTYTFFYFNVYLGFLSLFIAIVLGFCRIIQGLHFPLDVLVGFMIATFACVFYF